MINIPKVFIILILFSGFITFNMMVNIDELSYKTTELIRPYMLELDNHDIHFKHNFCESKLQNDNQPEIWNAYT